MGHREVKRVPLDFNWPEDQVWGGYLNPYNGGYSCKKCDGTGFNEATKELEDTFYGWDNPLDRWCDSITQDEVEALVTEGELQGFVKTKYDGDLKIYVLEEGEKIPTAEEVNKCDEIFKHGNGRYILIKTRAKRLGVYGLCDACKSGWIDNLDEKIMKLHNEWEGMEPPEGDGWQLWETTSEGSPSSPVFISAEKLAEWCEVNATIFGSEKISKNEWLEMFLEDSLDDGSLMVLDTNNPDKGIFHLGSIK